MYRIWLVVDVWPPEHGTISGGTKVGGLVGSDGMLMPNSVEVVFAFGVARRSATTAAIMFVAAVCEVALRFVCTPIGTKPKTAIKQKAAIPRARVSSTRENAWTRRRPNIISCKF